MNLFDILKQIPVTPLDDSPIPSYLYGAFRRKSITFFNGLTDENTIVYWFQSKSFTIDLRLKHAQDTPITERQGWIGTTLWNDEQQLLSWDGAAHESYQNHNQWPEPAKLHAIGNCILEFSPNNVYVEDWRQQAVQGLFLGLRLSHAKHLSSGKQLKMAGGLIICGRHIAYVQSRLPEIQNDILAHTDLTQALNANINLEDINSFEVSISTDGQQMRYSTQNEKIAKGLDWENFDLSDDGNITKIIEIHGQPYQLVFEVDVYQKDYPFDRQTLTSNASQVWLAQEKTHLLHHAKEVN